MKKFLLVMFVVGCGTNTVEKDLSVGDLAFDAGIYQKDLFVQDIEVSVDMSPDMTVSPDTQCLLPTGTYSMTMELVYSDCLGEFPFSIRPTIDWEVNDSIVCMSEFAPRKWSRTEQRVPVCKTNRETALCVFYYMDYWISGTSYFVVRRFLHIECVEAGNTLCFCDKRILLKGSWKGE